MSLDLEAMRGLVGESQLSVESARTILDETRASIDDVADVSLRPLWAVLEARVRNHQPIDNAGVQYALRGQSAALQEVARSVVHTVDLGVARERLTLLRDAGIRRRLIEHLRATAGAVKGGSALGEVDALLREASQLLQGAGSRVRNCAGDAVAMLDAADMRWQGRGAPALMMGLGDLDKTIGGLINNLIVIGARTGVGKSALVAGLVRNWLRAGLKVGVLCYEDDARDMASRIVACESGASLKEVRGDVTPSKHVQSEIGDAYEWFQKVEHLLEVDDARPSGSSTDVIASIRTMAARGCRAVILDNMTCVRLDGPEDRRHDLLVERALADIRSEAQALRIPAIVVGHLKRGQSEADESRKPPKLSDFSNASAWENYARVAFGMWRDGEDIALKVLKQTNGPPEDVFTLEFRKSAAVVTGATLRNATPPPPPEEHSRRWPNSGDK